MVGNVNASRKSTQLMSTHYSYYNGSRFIDIDLQVYPFNIALRMSDTDKQEFITLYFERQKALKAYKTARLWGSDKTLEKRGQAMDVIEAKREALINKYPAQ